MGLKAAATHTQTNIKLCTSSSSAVLPFVDFPVRVPWIYVLFSLGSFFADGVVASTAAKAGTLASSLSCTCTERPREWCRTWPCGVLEGERPPRNACFVQGLVALFQKHPDQALALLQASSYLHVMATLDARLSRLLSPKNKNEDF